jgi:hypothetical protein
MPSSLGVHSAGDFCHSHVRFPTLMEWRPPIGLLFVAPSSGSRAANRRTMRDTAAQFLGMDRAAAGFTWPTRSCGSPLRLRVDAIPGDSMRGSDHALRTITIGKAN